MLYGLKRAKMGQFFVVFEKRRVILVKKCNFAVDYGGEDTDISAS